MTVTNADISASFNELADLLDIEGANVFRVRAYRNAARVIGDLSHDINRYIEEGNDLTELPYIGRDLAGKIVEMVKTGRLEVLERTRKELPPGVTELLGIPGLGPRRVANLVNDLKVRSIEELARLCHEHKIQKLAGFGEKTEAHILEEIEGQRARETRIKLSIAEQYAAPLLSYLSKSPVCTQAIVAGSFRRRKDTVGDLDILVLSPAPDHAIEYATMYEDVMRILARGSTRATIILKSKLQVDIRVVPPTSFGAALYYFTGSKAHNIAIRQLARDRGLKLNEYGLFRGDKLLPSATEKEIFRSLGLPFIPPELRENRGEVEAALNRDLPKLVNLHDLRGDLHSHTKASDGRDTLNKMAEAAKRFGLEYLAISDHSPSLRIAHGLDANRLRTQMREIDLLNQQLDGIVLLKAMEVDILPDGTLDMPDEILEMLDLTICSVHSKFNLPKEAQTRRILKAMDNCNFTIFGHPTGRLLGERRSIDFDMEAVIAHAGRRRCFLELNAHPERLDLTDIYCRLAREAGVLVSINSDAHSVFDFEDLRFGTDQARRGWLEKKDVLNTRSLKELKLLLESRKTANN